MMTMVTSNEDYVLWQVPNSEDEPIPEPALLIKEYSDMLGIVQEGNEVLVNKNKENLRQLIKVLKLKSDAL